MFKKITVVVLVLALGLLVAANASAGIDTANGWYEGEEIYDKTGPWAMVIPGEDRISLEGNQQLKHRFRIYVNFLQGASEATLPSLRGIAEQGFDALLEDQTHNSTCWNCLPTDWKPGFMSEGEYNFIGIQTVWTADNYQTFPLPEYQGNTYTEMEGVVETIVEEIKDELLNVPEIDSITEGENPYEGKGVVAWIIPGEDRITHSSRSRLEHRMTIYQNLLASSGSKTLREMREIGEAAYDEMMTDITHDQTCTVCLPRLYHPGYLRIGDYRYVGIMSRWEARILHTYTPT